MSAPTALRERLVAAIGRALAECDHLVPGGMPWDVASGDPAPIPRERWPRWAKVASAELARLDSGDDPAAVLRDTLVMMDRAGCNCPSSWWAVQRALAEVEA